jgi:tRNA nucleotidyltransferase/poly(A) polymerase
VSGSPDEADVLLLVARALETAGVDYLVGGSVASSLLGEPRSTNDIDFAVRLREGEVPALIKALGPDFAADETSLTEAVRAGRSANIFYLPLVTKVDLFMRGSEPFDAVEFARRVKVEVRRGEPPIFVSSLEDSVLRKLVWFRSGGEVSDRQWRDVLGLLRASDAPADRKHLEQWARQLGVEDLLERAFKQA